MSQLDFQASFTRKNYHESYPTVSSCNLSITTAEKIVIVSERSKDIGLIITNAFGIARASEIILMARNKITLKQIKNNFQAFCLNNKLLYCAVDYTNIESMIIMFDIIRKNLKELSILILNAAYFHSSI